MKRIIVFDFGGVLINWDPRHLYRKIFDDEAEMEWFLANVCTMDWNLRQDEGRPFADAVKLLQKDHPKYNDHIEAFHTRWQEMLNGPVEETVNILNELKANGNTIYGLTNWSAETFHVALGLFEFLHTLDGIVVSGIEKMVKPNPAIFELLLNRYNLTTRECVFIDDNIHNIESAKALGFETIHFTTSAGLRERLQELDIL